MTGDTNGNTVAWTMVKATVWPWHWGESLQLMSERLPRFGICNVVRILWHRDNAWHLCREAHFWWAQRWSRKKDKIAARETLAWFSIGNFSISAANLMVLPIPVYVAQYSWYFTPRVHFICPFVHFNKWCIQSIYNSSCSQQKVLNIYTSKTAHLERRGEIQYLAMRSRLPFATLAVIR